MKKIVVSGMQLCQQMSGIPRYTYEIVKRLDKLINDYGLEVILCYPEEKNLLNPGLNNIKVVPLKQGKRKWMTQVLRRYANQEKALLCDFSWGICLKKKSITTIHDIRPYLKIYDTLRTRLYFRLLLFVIKVTKTTVVTVSYTQEKKIQKLLPKNKVEVITNGWEHMLDMKEDETVFHRITGIEKGEYFFALGSIAKHKNIRWIYEVARRNPDKQFVVSGNISKEIYKIDNKEFDIPNIIFTGYVSDEEIKALMKNCKAFLQASLYEGFGIPPLEALSLNKPIAISNIPVFKEIFGTVANFFDVDEYDFDLSKIQPADEKAREKVLAMYSWDKSANMWLELLVSCLKD